MPENSSSAFVPSARPAADQDRTATESQIIHVQLRPGTQSRGKCLAHLERTLTQHPTVEVHIAGYARDSHQELLTLAVSLGPRDQIAKPSEEAVAGFNFVSSVFTEMFDFLPQYTTEPTPAERANAAKLLHLIATAGTERAADDLAL